VSPTTWDVVDLALAVLIAAGFYYYYVAGVVDENRALSRASALAFLICGAVAVWMLVRILR
jgi:hypothetical protein